MLRIIESCLMENFMMRVKNEDHKINEVVTRIADAVHPTKIIMFGSRARGDGRADSDLDLVIIYDGPRSKKELKMDVRRLFRKPDFAMDLFVLTPAELNQQKNVVSTIARAANLEGVVCYG